MTEREDKYVTSDRCELHHRVMEAQLELLKQKDKFLEEKVGGIEATLGDMKKKIDDLIKWQADQYKLQLGMAIAIVLILIGVVLGRGFDMGLLT